MEIFLTCCETKQLLLEDVNMSTLRNNPSKNIRNGAKKNKIFISWSGVNSKEIARAIKNVFENDVFCGTGLECFVSDQDIASGSDWWNKINKELKSCKIGIICITKENLNARWIYYEAGAMVAQSVQTIPLLISCDFKSLNETPLNGKQAVNFYDQTKFIKMICDIRDIMGFNFLSKKQTETIGNEAYVELKSRLEPVLKKLRDLRILNDKYVYPSSVTAIKRNSIYISVPMASIPDFLEYSNLRRFLIKLKATLIKVGFTEVHCPMIDIEDKEHFDGKTKAIKDNFTLLKQIDSLLVIYPRRLPSSALVESGYGIALSKKMVIFYSEGLPYMLESAGSYIQNVITHQFKSLEEINQIILSSIAKYPKV